MSLFIKSFLRWQPYFEQAVGGDGFFCPPNSNSPVLLVGTALPILRKSNNPWLHEINIKILNFIVLHFTFSDTFFGSFICLNSFTSNSGVFRSFEKSRKSKMADARWPPFWESWRNSQVIWRHQVMWWTSTKTLFRGLIISPQSFVVVALTVSLPRVPLSKFKTNPNCFFSLFLVVNSNNFLCIVVSCYLSRVPEKKAIKEGAPHPPLLGRSNCCVHIAWFEPRSPKQKVKLVILKWKMW